MDGFQAGAGSELVFVESDIDKRSDAPPPKDQHHQGIYGGWDESDLPPFEPPAKPPIPVVSRRRR